MVDPKYRILANSVLYEINSDPIQLLELGCGEIMLTDTALNELIEHIAIASEFCKIDSEKYFKKLLFEVMRGHKNND